MARKSRVNLTETPAEVMSFVFLAGLYLRLSDEDGDDIETNSIGNQKKLAYHYLADHPEIQVIDTYIDHGYTGMNFRRPEFMRMKEDFISGKINCIIVKDVSRLGRNFVQTSEYVEKIFPDLGIRLICVNDNYDSIDTSADSAALMLPFKMVMNDAYSRDTSAKIRSSITAKMNNGEYLPSASSIPYGYIRNPNKITFDVDTEAAECVNLIFQLRAERMPFNSIAKELNKRNIPCPGKLRFIRGLTKNELYAHAEWIRGTIRKITGDPVYLGHRIHGKVKRDKIGLDKTRRPKEEWQIIENTHPPIISKELFDMVQKINFEEVEKRRQFEKRAEPGLDYRSVFRDKLFCADCGAKMVAQKGCARSEAKTPSRIFFDCNNYRYSNHQRCCSHYIRQETVMEAVSDLLNKQIEIAVDVEKLLKDVAQMPKINNYQSGIRDQLLSVATRKKNLEMKIEQLLIDLTEGLLDRDEYEYIKKNYTHQLVQLSDLEDSLNIRAQGFDSAVMTTQKWLHAIKEYKALPVINREIVDILIEKILISDSQKVKIELAYKDPYEPLKTYIKEIEVIQSAS